MYGIHYQTPIHSCFILTAEFRIFIKVPNLSDHLPHLNKAFVGIVS